MLKMSGRICNAMLKFAGAAKGDKNFEKLFFNNCKIYATDSIAMCCWTPAVQETVVDNEINSFYFVLTGKITANTPVYIDGTGIGIDIDCNSKMLTTANLDAVMTGSQKFSQDRILGINPDYLAAIANLGKAVRSDKCGVDGTVNIDWNQNMLHAYINAGCNGHFDIVVMPIVDTKQNQK